MTLSGFGYRTELYPMIKHLLFLSILLLTIPSLAQVSPQLTGATGVPGTLSPSSPNELITLKKQIIYFKGFREHDIGNKVMVPLASYQNLLEFNNTSGQPQSVECHIPVNVFFTNFTRGNRSVILDNLARIMPDLFNFAKDEQSIKEDLERKFAKRNFIRRIINIRDLDKVHMDVRLWVNDQEVKLSRITMEFRYYRDRENDMEVLSMEADLGFAINFKAEDKTVVRFNLLAPAFKTGQDATYYFSPFMTGGGRSWAGNIEKIYTVYPSVENTLLIPYYMNTEWKAFGFGQNVAILSNHEPELNEKIGFYARRNASCQCYQGDGSAQPVHFPTGLKSVSASSWYKNRPSEAGRCLTTNPDMEVLRWVPDFDLGSYGKLSLDNKQLEVRHPSQPLLNQIVTSDCSVSGEPILQFNEGYHPLWAFDAAPDSFNFEDRGYQSNVGSNSSWCVREANSGKGQYLSFTITQPVDLVKLYTANYQDRANYNKYNRVKRFELIQQDGNHKQEFLLSDILTSSYVVELQPGTYKLFIREIYPGVNDEVTCVGSIELHFAGPDDWFIKYFNQL